LASALDEFVRRGLLPPGDTVRAAGRFFELVAASNAIGAMLAMWWIRLDEDEGSVGA